MKPQYLAAACLAAFGLLLGTGCDDDGVRPRRLKPLYEIDFDDREAGPLRPNNYPSQDLAFVGGDYLVISRRGQHVLASEHNRQYGPIAGMFAPLRADELRVWIQPLQDGTAEYTLRAVNRDHEPLGEHTKLSTQDANDPAHEGYHPIELELPKARDIFRFTVEVRFIRSSIPTMFNMPFGLTEMSFRTDAKF
jgi:hypothetical protein